MRQGLAIFQGRDGVEAQFDGAAIDGQTAPSATQGSHVAPTAVVDFLDGLTPCARFTDAREQHETKAQGNVRENRLHREKVVEIQNMALTWKIPEPSSSHTADEAHVPPLWPCMKD